MTRRDTKRKLFTRRDFYVDIRRSRISHNNDTRRLMQLIRSIAVRRMKNYDADMRALSAS